MSAACYIRYICSTTGTIIRLPEEAPLLHYKADTPTAPAKRLRPMHNRAHKSGSNLSRKEVTSAMHQDPTFTVPKKLYDLTAKTAAQHILRHSCKYLPPLFYCCANTYARSQMCSCVPKSLVASRDNEVASTKQGSSNGISLGKTS